MRRILIVDDGEINRKMLRKMLDQDYQVMESISGEEALALLDRDSESISAVLLDIGLPGIDGYQVLSRIRGDKRFSRMPVIMITADNDEATRLKALQLGADDFVMKPYHGEILKHCLQNQIAMREAAAAPVRVKTAKYKPALKPVFGLRTLVVFACVLSLLLSLGVEYFRIHSELKRTCENVTVDFVSIMDGYQHSFQLFELLLQEEIQNADNLQKIESFLKTQDQRLLAIEGGDYDGIYLYYQGQYLYSWDTPYSAYSSTGYDATTRPWYLGAIDAKGEIFFSTPYPSYANDYMLATISRLQGDGETVIAYDIKLGEIEKYVNRLYLHPGALALICDEKANIIGSTEPLYQGGNYAMTARQLSQAVAVAAQNLADSGGRDASAVQALKSAEALEWFVDREGAYLADLQAHPGRLRCSPGNFSFGYAYTGEGYTCFVITPIGTMLPQVALFWAAFSFALMALILLIRKMRRRNHQILSDVLTGLNNRRAFLKYCDNHILHHADETLGLLMLDLNRFKQINDLYGHAVGDQALLDTATVLKNACSASSENYFLCRYGGDEFLLAARVPDLSALQRMTERIATGFKRKNQTSITLYTLEASMGVACGACRDQKSVELLLTQADQAMYEEKRRNGTA